MPAAPCIPKPSPPPTGVGVRLRPEPALAGGAAAFVFLPGGPAAPKPSHYTAAVTTAESGLASDQVTIDIRHEVASRMVREAVSATRSRYLASVAAARLAQQHAAQQHAAQQQAAQQQAAAQPS